MIMNKHRIISTVIFCVLSMGTTRATLAIEPMVHEIDDYLNPRERIITTPEKTEKTASFLASHLYTGGDYNYQYRNTFTESNVFFAELVNGFYFSRKQINLKLTSLRNDNCENNAPCENMPIYKSQVQLAHYDNFEPDNPDYMPGRWQCSWTVEKYEDKDELMHELVVDMDVFCIDKEDGVTGFSGFILAWKPSEKEAFWGYRASFYPKGWDREWITSLIALTVTGERKGDDTRWGIVRGDLSTRLKMPKLPSSLHISVVTSYQIREKKWNRELAAFVGVPVFARVFR